MADLFANYAELAAAKVEGQDYQVSYEDNGSDMLLFSPHAGGIEIGSSELIHAISQDRPEWNWYLFEGLQSSNNSELHITSTNFDEPRALNMMSKASRSVTIHGKAGDLPDTAIGGLDAPLRNTLWKKLEERGFTVVRASGGIAGLEPDNIVNRNLRGHGVQLELSTAQRKAFFKDNDWSKAKRTDPANWTQTLHDYKQAIIDAVEEVYGRQFDVSTTFLMNFEGNLEYGKGYQNEMATRLQSKVDQTVFDPVKGTVEQHTSEINQMADVLETKVGQEVFDTVEERVTQNESTLTQQAELIKSKVDQTAFDDLGDVVSQNSSTIQQQADLIQTKVTEEEVKEIGRRQERLKVRYIRDTLNGSNKSSSNLWGEIKVMRQGANLANGILPTSSTAPTGSFGLEVITDEATDKSCSINGTDVWVQIDLGQTYEDIEYLHIWHYDYDAGRAFNHKSQVSEDGVNWYTLFDSSKDGAVNEVSGGFKIIINNAVTLGEMQTTIDKHGSSITQLSDEIQTKVEESAFNSLTGTVEEHTSTLTQHANEIEARVEKGDVVQQVNLDTSGLTIDVSKLDIKGVTTFIASGYPNMIPPKLDSFEQFPTGTLENWKDVGYTTSLNICDITTDYSLDGGKALRVRSAVDNDGWVYLSNGSSNFNIDVIEGKTYMFSFYAYNFNNTLAGVKGAVKDSAGNFYHTDQVEINKNNGWVRFERKVTIPSGVTSVNTVLYNQKGGISVVFDCIQFEEVEPDVLRASSWKPVSATIINGANIETGTMSWEAGYGGNLTLGGKGNANGRFVVLNDNDEVIADLDAGKGGFSDLYVANLEAPNVVSYSSDDMDIYVSDRWLDYTGAIDPNDNNTGDGWARPLRTIAEALRRIPKYYDGKATIHIAYQSTFYEDIRIKSITGAGSVTIEGQGSKIQGGIGVYACSAQIFVKQLTVNGRSGSYSIVGVYQTPYCVLQNLYVYGNSSDRGIDILQGSYAQVTDCEIYDVKQAILGRYGGTAYVYNCKGYGSSAGLYAHGGYITGGGTAPNGGVLSGEGYGGKVFGSFTANSGAATPPAPPETTTVWNSTSGDSWRDNFGGQWYGQNEVVQGYWGGYGVYKGLWMFGTAPSSAVTGKTIKSMRLYVKRNSSGGNSGDVKCYFRPHAYTSKPSGSPSYLNASTTASFRWGVGKWITLPSSFHSLFESGSAKGIGIYIDSTSSNYYAKFGMTAKLEITYA
ncbi:poly-gamma-glutamate hydrolase family protein [Priestia megaterium]|uniref:poly-gamma-glutamate hydrolase family protein n=1 Tax=Priestia megaterium TaxID=1404 RepID=UPI00203FD653|nr:poly-gamma-glutamate hydrolase family protein [Priestia megaterium]MCM3155611.1 poly-gamma-glutamate hydrolase family protein [Priestia megaterium]